MAKKDTVNYADIINRIALTREIEESKVVEALKDSVVTVLMRMERNSEKSIDEMEELIEVNFDIDKKLFEIYITREIVESEPKGLFEIDMVTAKALLKKKRLKALEEHWREIFDLEKGKYSLKYKNNQLILEVKRCPAVSHILKMRYKLSDSFCESTRIVNETICKEAGYKCSLKLGNKKGTCEQKFWKEGK